MLRSTLTATPSFRRMASLSLTSSKNTITFTLLRSTVTCSHRNELFHTGRRPKSSNTSPFPRIHSEKGSNSKKNVKKFGQEKKYTGAQDQNTKGSTWKHLNVGRNNNYNKNKNRSGTQLWDKGPNQKRNNGNGNKWSINNGHNQLSQIDGLPNANDSNKGIINPTKTNTIKPFTYKNNTDKNGTQANTTITKDTTTTATQRNENNKPIHPIEKLRESFMQSLQTDRERRKNEVGDDKSKSQSGNNNHRSRSSTSPVSTTFKSSTESKLDQLLRMSRLGASSNNDYNNYYYQMNYNGSHTSGAKAFRERRKMQQRQQKQQQQQQDQQQQHQTNNRYRNFNPNVMGPNASKLQQELLKETNMNTASDNDGNNNLRSDEDDKIVILPRKDLTITDISNLFRVHKKTIHKTLRSLGESVPKSVLQTTSSNASDDAENEYKIDIDLAELIALELGLDPQRAKRTSCQLGDAERRMLRINDEENDSDEMHRSLIEMETLPSRPPVVCIMGHVDHGKTTLMDSLRQRALEAEGNMKKQKLKKSKKKKKGKNSNENEIKKVAGTEAGGITQTVSAFQVALPSSSVEEGKDDNKAIDKVTFLDTPGHAAFKAMRQSGSNCGDVIVLVIAADDGISPQTIEIIDMYKSIASSQPGSISLVVAMTKIDKPGIDVEESKMRIESQLMEHDIYTESITNNADYEFGGVQLIPVSGLTGEGVDDLIEGLALQSEIMDLRACDQARAEGLIIDAKMEKGLGVVADCIIRWGKLELGDYVVSGVHGGRIRILNDVNNKGIKKAGPSQPVRIIGLKTLPKAGDPIVCVQSEEMAKEIIDRREAQATKESHRAESSGSLDVQISGGASKKGFMAQNVLNRYDLNEDEEDEDLIRIPVILKADADGTLAALRETLLAIQEESKLNLRIDPISLGIGHITPSDVTLAAESGAGIFCFNLKGSKDKAAMSLAASEGVEIRGHDVIYHLLDEAKDVFSTYCPPTPVEIIHGKATVKQVFDINNNKNAERVAGLMVEEGFFFLDKSCEKTGKLECNYRVLRGNDVISPDGLRARSLRQVKEEVSSVKRGVECGVNLKDYFDIEKGDIIECFSVEMKRKFV